eukprot:41088_1
MGCMVSKRDHLDTSNDEKELLDHTVVNAKYDFVTEYNTKLDENVKYKEAVSRRPSVSIFIADIAELNVEEKETEDDVDENTVFIKKYFKSDEWNSLSFRREATILSKLSHKNIIPYISSYEDDIAYYLAIEYCNEGTLISYIYNQYLHANNDQSTIYNESIIYNILSILISVLSHCHSRKIVHRNICLENIHVSNGKYKIIGWDDAEIIDNKHDVYNDFVGENVYYLSPETLQIRHGGELKKIDIFAVGVIAFILAFGSVPFSGIHHTNICKRIMKNECNWPKHKNDYVSTELSTFIKALLSPYPFSRPSANEAKGMLRKYHVHMQQDELNRDYSLIEPVPFKLHCYESSMKIRKLLMDNACNKWTNFEQNELICVLENIFNLQKEEICETDLEHLLNKMGFTKNESQYKTKQFFDIMDVQHNGQININSFNVKRRQCAQRINSSSNTYTYSIIQT